MKPNGKNKIAGALTTAAAFILSGSWLDAQTAREPGASAPRVEEVVQLNPFEVTGTDDGGYSVKDTIVATGFNQELRRTPLIVNIVTDDFIREAGLTSYADIAEFVPNTYIQPDPYALGSTSFARGHSTSYFAQDGVRNYTEPFVSSAQRVEVIKGPATLFFGRAQPGGIFNFSTPPPSQRKLRQISFTYGPFNTAAFDLAAQGKLGGEKHFVTCRLDAKWQEGGSFVDHGFDDQRFVRAVVAYAPHKTLNVRFGYEQSKRTTSGLAQAPVVLNPQYFADYVNPRPEQIAQERVRLGAPGATRTQAEVVTSLQGRWRENDANWANDTRLAFRQDLGPARQIGFDPSLTAYGWDYNASLLGSYAIKDVWNWGPSVFYTPNDHIAFAAPIGGRLYLPESWTKDQGRCARAGVPEEIGFATKPMIALQLLQEALADDVAPAPVLGDAAYGDNAEFRAGVRALGLEFSLQVDAAKHKGWNFAVPTELKQVRRHPTADAPPSQTLVEIAAGIPAAHWQAAHWKRASGERGATRLAWCEVWLQHALRKAGGELEKLWLVVDWPADAAEPYHYYLAHLHRPPTKARCLTLSRSRWHIEQYFQRAKDDLGFDHFEGRSWTGFHHHLVLSALAYLFILTIHARAKKNFWCDVGTDAARDPSVAGEVNRLLLLLRQQI